MAQDTSSLLKEAETAAAQHDLKNAGLLLKRILDLDFTNLGAWQLLHRLLGGNQPLESFRTTFVARYYPDKTGMFQVAATPIVPSHDRRRERAALIMQLTELEKQIVPWENYLQGQRRVESDASRQVTIAEVGMVIGLLLTPVVIGIFLIIAGVMALLTNRSKRDDARNNQNRALSAIARLRASASDVRAQLALLE